MPMNSVQDRALHQPTANTFNAVDWIAVVLMIIGGINWGLVGLFHFDLVAALFGADSGISRVVYVLVGLAALYGIYTLTRMRSTR